MIGSDLPENTGVEIGKILTLDVSDAQKRSILMRHGVPRFRRMLMRYLVVVALFILSMITYIDRVCISTAKEPISRDLALSDTAMGMVFGAFALGYALAQIPSGWFADRFGPRLALAVVVTAWSALTALTGAAWSLASLVAIRFLFRHRRSGRVSRQRARHLQLASGGRAGPRQRGAVLRVAAGRGAVVSAARLDVGALGLATVVSDSGPARCGLGDSLAAVVSRSPGEAACRFRRLQQGRPSALRDVFRSRALALAMVQYFASNFTFFICLSWMLPYLKKQYHLSDGEAAVVRHGAAAAGRDLAVADRLAGGSPVPLAWRAWSRRLPGDAGLRACRRRRARPDARGIRRASPCCASPLAAFGADMTISPSWVYLRRYRGQEGGQRLGRDEHAGQPRLVRQRQCISISPGPDRQRLGLLSSLAAVINVGGAVLLVPHDDPWSLRTHNMKATLPLKGVAMGAGYFSRFQYEAWTRIPEVGDRRPSTTAPKRRLAR